MSTIPSNDKEMNQPALLDEIELLRRYSIQKSWSNAQLATSMTAFGWQWTERFVAALFAGTMKASGDKRDYIKRYLLSSYEGEVLV